MTTQVHPMYYCGMYNTEKCISACFCFGIPTLDVLTLAQLKVFRHVFSIYIHKIMHVSKYIT